MSTATSDKLRLAIEMGAPEQGYAELDYSADRLEDLREYEVEEIIHILGKTERPHLADIVDDVREVDTESKPRRSGTKWTSPGRLVLSWPDLDDTARLVLFTLAAHGKNDGTSIRPTQTTIGTYIEKDRKTVNRAIKRLVEAGAITMTAKGRRDEPNTYRLNRGPRMV